MRLPDATHLVARNASGSPVFEVHMDLTRALNLAPLNSPLRHYTVAAMNGDYVFTHRNGDEVHRVRIPDAHAAWMDQPPDLEPIHVFERLLPHLCYGCGHRLEIDTDGVCPSCVADDVAALREALGG